MMIPNQDNTCEDAEDLSDKVCSMCGVLPKHVSNLGQYCPECEAILYEALSAL